jgi:hypothetical protein
MMRCLKCRKAKCVCRIPDEVWLCYDVDNGDGIERHPDAKHYVWWFSTRLAALRHMKERRRNRRYTRLIGPFMYVWAEPEPKRKRRKK